MPHKRQVHLFRDATSIILFFDNVEEENKTSIFHFLVNRSTNWTGDRAAATAQPLYSPKPLQLKHN